VTDTLAACTAIAALLALGAGVMKLSRPHNTVVALDAVLGREVAPAAVRLGSAVEIAIGGLSLAGSRIGAVALAGSYVAFAAFVAVALRRGAPVSSCGCFGEPDVPPTVGHVLFDVAAAISATVLAVRGPRPIGSLLADQPLGGVPLVLLVLVATACAYLLLAEQPKLAAVVRSLAAPGEE
jgi:hypothetical protein